MKNRKITIVGLSIVACALCCLIPIAGSVLGLTLLASFPSWLGITSIAVLGIGLFGSLIGYLKNKVLIRHGAQIAQQIVVAIYLVQKQRKKQQSLINKNILSCS